MHINIMNIIQNCMLGCKRQIRADGFKQMPFLYLHHGNRACKNKKYFVVVFFC